jgi:hypothetical protein
VDAGSCIKVEGSKVRFEPPAMTEPQKLNAAVRHEAHANVWSSANLLRNPRPTLRHALHSVLQWQTPAHPNEHGRH